MQSDIRKMSIPKGQPATYPLVLRNVSYFCDDLSCGPYKEINGRSLSQESNGSEVK